MLQVEKKKGQKIIHSLWQVSKSKNTSEVCFSYQKKPSKYASRNSFIKCFEKEIKII